MKWILALVMAGVGTIVVMSLISRGRADDRVSVVGSTSVQPFAEMLAEEYHDHEVEVQGGGSTAGVQAVLNGIAEVGMVSRSLADEELAQSFDATVIARDGLAVVVHSSNPVDSLTPDQIRDLFSGRATNWQKVGGRDATVRPITREEGSGTREAFVKLVMGKMRISRKALTQESNGAVKELVSHDPSGIGYMSLGLVGDDLKVLKVSGVTPSKETVLSEEYPLVRPFMFVTRGPVSPAAREFIDFVLSERGQQMLEEEGLIGPGEKRTDN